MARTVRKYEAYEVICECGRTFESRTLEPKCVCGSTHLITWPIPYESDEADLVGCGGAPAAA